MRGKGEFGRRTALYLFQNAAKRKEEQETSKTRPNKLSIHRGRRRGGREKVYKGTAVSESQSRPSSV